MALDASATGTSQHASHEGWALIAPDGVLVSADAVFIRLLGLEERVGRTAPSEFLGRPWRALALRGLESLVENVADGARYGLPWRATVHVEGAPGARPLLIEGTAAHRTVVLRVRTGPASPPTTPAAVAPTPAAPPVAAAPRQARATPAPSTETVPPHVASEALTATLEQLAHELNNPLTAIAGYARALASLPPAEQAHALEVIEAEALRAGDVVRGLLEAARRDAARPVARSPLEESAPAEVTPAQPTPTRPRVLVVDDEDSIRAVTTQALGTSGYDAVAAASAEAALALLEAGAFEALVTDIRRPGMDGIALHAEVSRRWPDLARHTVIISGDTHAEAVASLVRHAGLPALEKPFRLDALLGAIAQVLSDRR
ncbi:MAG: response regulator [Dehalococcoidia bacterium]